MHVPVRQKGKIDESKEAWIRRDIVALVRKIVEAGDKHRQLRSSVSLEEIQKLRSILKKEIRRA